MVGFGIFNLLESFGLEAETLSPEGIYAIFIICFFAGFWFLLNYFLSKKGTEQTLLSKRLSPLLAIFFTVALMVDFGSAEVKSPEDFVKGITGLFGFLISIALSGVLVWASFKFDRKNKSNFSKLILFSSIYITSSTMLLHFDDTILNFLIPGSNLDTFGQEISEQIVFLKEIIQLFNSISSIAVLVYAFKSMGIFGLKGAKGANKWRQEYVSDYKEDFEDFGTAKKNIDNLVKQGNDIYKKIADVISSKGDVTSEKLFNDLKYLQNYSTQILKYLKDMDKVNDKTIRSFSKRVLTVSNFNQEMLNNLKSNFGLMISNLDDLNSQISNFMKKDAKNDLNNLYNLSMEWYRFADLYVKSKNTIDKELENIQSNLNRLKEIEKIEIELEKMKLGVKEFDKMFNEAVLNSLNKISLDKTIEDSEKYIYFQFLKIIFSEMKLFLTKEVLAELKDLIPLGENLFENFTNDILNTIDKKEIKEDNYDFMRNFVKQKLAEFYRGRKVNNNSESKKEDNLTMNPIGDEEPNLDAGKGVQGVKVSELKEFKKNFDSLFANLMKENGENINVQSLIQLFGSFNLSSLSGEERKLFLKIRGLLENKLNKDNTTINKRYLAMVGQALKRFISKYNI